MATGSGKTVTALSIATKLVTNILKNDMIMIIGICVPYKHLAEQWKVSTKF
ncbi:MAG: DEAD/DEAH box helicase family protein [Nitrosomonas sp.]|nr:DEAD/DEAH box helicase family protein [Nitrosomonas sp.]